MAQQYVLRQSARIWNEDQEVPRFSSSLSISALGVTDQQSDKVIPRSHPPSSENEQKSLPGIRPPARLELHLYKQQVMK